MKRILLLATALCLSIGAFAQSDYNYQKRSLFEILPIQSTDIVFLGNSITDGCEWAELFNDPRMKNRGISADRSSWLLDRLDPIIKGQPRKLFLMIGTNDLAAGVTPEAVAANTAVVISRFLMESPKTELYIQSILPVNGVDTQSKHKNHWDRGAQIIETNNRLKALCAEYGITYVDLYSALLDDRGLLDKRYTNDGLHLMGAGYLVWKAQIEKYIK